MFGKPLKFNDRQNATLRISHDAETNEWIIRVWENGERIESADYYASDKEDAIGTRQLMLGAYLNRGFMVSHPPIGR